MKLKIYLSIFFLSVFTSLFAQVAKDSLIVYTFEIDQNIGPGTYRLTKKALDEAKEAKADYVVIRLNTFGGTVDAAEKIRTELLRFEKPVIAWINNNAASAGALISIACDSIYMSSGANIGAATVVDQNGTPLPEKYQSYMRSMLRSTAEATGRDPIIAEAMNDPRIYIEGVNDSGKVVTFTTKEAIKNKYCEGEAESLEQVYKQMQIKPTLVIQHKETTIDNIISFLLNPMISGILILLMLGGIYFELQTPGIGFPLAVALTGALLYFAPLWLEGLADHWEILLFVVGLVLLGVEILVIPGFGVAGISGIVLIVAGLTLSLIGNKGFDFNMVLPDIIIKSLFTVIVSILLSIVVFLYFGNRFFGSNLFLKFVLQNEQKSEAGYTSPRTTMLNLVGKTGTSETILRPAGKVMIEDDLYDATALYGYVEKGEPIVVVKQETSQIFVRKVS